MVLDGILLSVEDCGICKLTNTDHVAGILQTLQRGVHNVANVEL